MIVLIIPAIKNGREIVYNRGDYELYKTLKQNDVAIE
jgi:zona occludens toxin (predicted ATPase)